MKALLSITRSITGLNALVLEISARKGDDSHTSDKNGTSRLVVALPLSDLPVELYREKEKLLHHYSRLEQTKSNDLRSSAVLASTLIVLASTVRDRRENPQRTPTIRTEPPQKAPATAAHPRAYKGTKYKPPKDATPDFANLCITLCDPTSSNELLTRLQPFWTEAIAQVEQTIKLPHGLPRVSDQETLTTDYIWFAYNHFAQINETVELPFLLQQHFATCLRGVKFPHLLEFLELYHQLNLESDETLRLQVCEFVHSCNTFALALHLLTIIASLPQTLRSTILELVLENELVGTPYLARLTYKDIFFLIDCYADFENRIAWYMQGLAAGASSDFILEGLRLSRDFFPNFSYETHRIKPGSLCASEKLDKFLAHASNWDGWCDMLPLRIWQKAQDLPGLDAVLVCEGWHQLTPFQVGNLLSEVLWSHDDVPTNWEYIRRNITEILQDILRVPCEFRDAYMKHLNLSYDAHEMERIHWRLRYMCGTAHRSELLETLSSRFLAQMCLLASQVQFDRFLHLPRQTFKHFEEFYRLENHRILMNWGFDCLLQRQPDFVLACLGNYTAKCLRVVRSLGCLPISNRERALADFSRSIIFLTDFEKLSSEELVELSENLRVAPGTHPIPDKLRCHLSGERLLSERQLKNQKELLRNRLPLARLQLLESLILRELPAGRPIDSSDDRITHALQLANTADENKRAFNKFIRAYVNGQEQYIEMHPLSRKWRLQHPKVRLDELKKIPVFEAYLADRGPVNITIEHDPLEALRMGTAVNTCLGTGGICSYSSIANVLDINKFVIFARDNNGLIFARQLAAVSGDEKLLTYCPYPDNLPTNVLELFCKFDEMIAHSLGIPLHRSEEAYDDVELIIASGWWDDMVWGDSWRKSATEFFSPE